MELETGADDANRRLDRILRKALPEYPLSLIHRLFRQGQVLVDGRAAAPGDRVRARAIITVPGVSPVPDSRRRFSRSPQTGIDVLWRERVCSSSTSRRDSRFTEPAVPGGQPSPVTVVQARPAAPAGQTLKRPYRVFSQP